MSFDDIQQNEDEAGITRSQAYIHSLIAKEIEKGIPSERIVLGGFSQGGAMSVFSGITNKEKLGGVFGLSCYLLLSDRIKNFMPEDWPNKKTPFFLAHGLDDDIVPHSFGEMSAKAMKELGLEDVSFRSYPSVFPNFSS